MACATAWMSALLARMAERPGRERLINVADESWKIVQHTGLGEWFQSNFKLARQFGVMNLVVLHKLADLQAAGDAGSRAARIAEGLIADASTRIVYHQDESQVPLTRTLLGLSESEARLISMLSAGPGAVARRQPLVRRPAPPLAAGGGADQHRHRHAGDRRHGGARMSDGRVASGISDGAVLGAIGCAVGARAAAVAVGRARRRAVRRTAGRRSAAAQLLGVLVRLPARLSDPAGAWPARACGRGSPGRGGFYAALALLARRPCRGAVAGRARAALSGRRTAARRRRAMGPRRRAAGAAQRTRATRRAARARAPRRPSAVRRAAPRAGRVRAAAVGQVRRAGGPGAARMGRARRSPPRSRPTCSRSRPSAGAALGTVFVFDPFALAADAVAHLVAAARGAAPGTARSRSPGGWPRRASSTSAASRAATSGRSPPSSGWRRCCTRPPRTGAGIDSGRALGLRAGRRASCTRRSATRDRRGRRRAASSPTPTPPTTRCARSRRRPTGRAPRSRRPPRRCCAPTGSRAWRARPRCCEITADRLLDERATLYLIGDAKASKLLRPIFLALLSEVVDRAYERATLAGGRLELPLLLCLDEAGNVAPLPNLAEIASTAPSHNIQLVSIFHDLAQARSRYGRQAETVVNSHRARMLLPGVADLETLRYFAGLIGEEEARDLTRTTGAGGTQPLERAAAPAAAGPRGAAPAARRPRAAALRAAGADPAAAADVVRGPAAATDWRAGHELRSNPTTAAGTTPTATTSTTSTSRSWPLDWRSLYPRERWMWFEQLWTDVCMLRERYRLAVRSGGGRTRSRSRRWPRWRRGAPLRLRRLGRPAGQAGAALRPRADRGAAARRSRARFTPTATGSRSPAT